MIRSAILSLAFFSAFSVCYVFARDAGAEDNAPRQSNSTEEVIETSKCQAPLQEFKGMVLVSFVADPDTLAAQSIYYKKLADGKIILFRLLRDDCTSPWHDGGIKVLEAPKAACVPTETISCI